MDRMPLAHSPQGKKGSRPHETKHNLLCVSSIVAINTASTFLASVAGY